MSSSGIPLPKAPRLLLIRLGAMGDVIHTLPAAALLRQVLPEADISWAVEPRWAPLLEGNPAIDRVIETRLKAWRKQMLSPETLRELRSLRAELRAQGFDAAIDFQGLIKSAALGRMAKPVELLGFERALLRERLAGWFYTRQFSANQQHVVDKNLALARAVAGVADEQPVEASLPAGERSAGLPEGPFLLASPCAGWKAKQWPPERYAELAALAWAEHQLPIVLDGAAADEVYLRDIARRAPPGSCCVHLSSLRELIGATRAARAVVGLDSGPLHLAAALGKPGVALFGPTDPARNGPYGGSFTVLRTPGAQTSYSRRNELSDSMAALSAERVWSELSSILDSRPVEAVNGGASQP